mmetsp:Transcript_82634/g.267478  ORF Transcript_82634/g.267478 Transcript_82634/m.267478 type:complete len:332 (+) Transcript_82634:141-1136(+)
MPTGAVLLHPSHNLPRFPPTAGKDALEELPLGKAVVQYPARVAAVAAGDEVQARAAELHARARRDQVFEHAAGDPHAHSTGVRGNLERALCTICTPLVVPQGRSLCGLSRCIVFDAEGALHVWRRALQAQQHRGDAVALLLLQHPLPEVRAADALQLPDVQPLQAQGLLQRHGGAGLALHDVLGGLLRPLLRLQSQRRRVWRGPSVLPQGAGDEVRPAETLQPRELLRLLPLLVEYALRLLTHPVRKQASDLLLREVQLLGETADGRRLPSLLPPLPRGEKPLAVFCAAPGLLQPPGLLQQFPCPLLRLLAFRMRRRQLRRLRWLPWLLPK